MPAYNEGGAFATALRIAKSASLIDDIIVINDGSNDDLMDITKVMKR